jgi:uncharacterized protein DUF5916/cellulose/xylan binding protein with CBM9 domain
MRLVTLLCVLLLGVTVALAQQPEPSDLKYDPGVQTGAKPISAKTGAITLSPEKANPVQIARFETPPVIDGKLDEEVWKKAAALGNFYQTQPGDNISPSHSTSVLIGYDSKSLYIAFRAYDEPDRVRATMAKRDQIFEEDRVQLILDTFNDRRKGYILAFNPLGVQADGIISEGSQTGPNGSEDYSLDIVMESKGRLTEDGYIVEVAVPFKSLRYEAGKGKLWGFHAFRRITRLDNENDSWMPISREESSLLNQAGHITGLEGISTERTLEIIPTLTLSESGIRVRTLSIAAVNADSSLLDPGRFVNPAANFDPGLTVKLGITPTVTLDFTANPDFAQVEADQPVLTANQRFPIFFDEKRPFFLEGADIFQTPLQTVHTRTIIDPDYAVKLSGKQGRNSFGLLLASDNAPGQFTDDEKGDPDFFPDIAGLIEKNSYIGVARLKRDIGRESSLGMIVTSYNFVEKHNQLGGLDGYFRLDKQTTFTFQVLGTTTRAFFFDPDIDDNVYRTGNALGYSWNYDKTGRNVGFNLQGQGRTKDYRAEVGFTRRVNTNYQGAFFRFSTDPKPKAMLISWRLVGGTNSNFDFSGRSQNLGGFVQSHFNLTRQTFFNIGYEEFYERIFEGEFGARRSSTQAGAFAGDDPERSLRGRALHGFIGTNRSKNYSAFLFLGHRWNIFDFDFGAGPRFPRVSAVALVDPDAPLDPGAANTFEVGASGEYKPTAAIRVSLDYNRSRFTREETGRTVFIANISSLRATYQFTRFTSVRARLDYDTLTSSFRGQYLFGWTPNPGTSVYIGYNDDLNVNGFNPFTSQHEPGFRRNGRTFFVKTSYLFRRSI